jgi:dipeptidyl-peptidase-4
LFSDCGPKMLRIAPPRLRVTGRVGVWAWSGGGTNTLHAMFRFAAVYSVGVAVAPLTDQTLYDTIYLEPLHGAAAR